MLRTSRERPQTRPQPQEWTWERFCREEAREAAYGFLERVRRFKSRHATARDVHDSTFTNEFSAAFLEESSILMANNDGETVLPTTSANGASFTTSLPASTMHGRTGSRESSVEASRNKPSGKSSWWSGLFKWSSKSKRSRERHSSGSSTASNSSPSLRGRIGGSTKQKKRVGIKVVKEASGVRFLNLSECEDGDGLNWAECKLMLVQQQENYQIEIYSPRNPMPKMSIFCFLIDEVRSTSRLEIPDSNSCFAIKSQNHGEYVFDVGEVIAKEEWVSLLQTYTRRSNGYIPRSSQASSHLATLPRAPSTSPHSSPLRSHAEVGGPGGTLPTLLTLESSPLLVSRSRENRLTPRQRAAQPAPAQPGPGAAIAPTTSIEPSSRHMSLSNPRKNSVLSTNIMSGDSEESVLVDMNSFMRNYSTTRSPGRQQKTMSMFAEPSAHITNPYVQAHAVNLVTSPPAPALAPSSRLAVAAEPPAQFPYASPHASPQGSPPPLPKRDHHRPHSMFIKNAIIDPAPGARPSPNEATPCPISPTNVRPLPPTPTSPGTLTPGTPTPMESRALPITPTEGTPLAEAPALPSRNPVKANGRTQPKRKISQSAILELPHRQGSLHDLPTPGSLETCSQSSSTAALHPVTIAALSKPRKNSIPFVPTSDDDGSSSSQAAATAGNCAWKGRKRKNSAPILQCTPSPSLEPKSPAVLEENQDERVKSKSPDNSVFVEKCPSPATFDLGKGFCEGEEQTDHATLSFPYFSQRSSPSQAQGSPGDTVEESEDRKPTPDRQQPVVRLSQTPPITMRCLTPPISRSSSRHPQTPPTDSPQTPPVDGNGSANLPREGASSRNSNLTNTSAHSTSSLDDSARNDSSAGNPIYVETTEGRGYSQTTVHTRHPYEYWATNQQDITNMRALSQYPWFHGMISRNNASQLVLENGDGGTGQYLVRQSESREGDFVLTFNYHNRAKHLRMSVDDSGCNIQHLHFDSVPVMLEYFKTNSIPLESFWLNDDVKLSTYIDRQASDAFRTTTVLNVDQLNRVPPRRSRSLHLGMSRSTANSNSSSHPGTPVEQTGNSSSTNSLPFSPSPASGWRQIFRSQRSSSAGNVGRVQRSHSHNAGSIQSTGPRRVGSGALSQHNNNRENSYVWRNY